MEKITTKAFEELVANDEALTARAKEITGEGDGLKEKVKAFAASLGYELVPDEPQELGLKQMENVAGGNRDYVCNHDFEFIKYVEGKVWGWSKLEKCRKCGCERVVWD